MIDCTVRASARYLASAGCRMAARGEPAGFIFTIDCTLRASARVEVGLVLIYVSLYLPPGNAPERLGLKLDEPVVGVQLHEVPDASVVGLCDRIAIHVKTEH